MSEWVSEWVYHLVLLKFILKFFIDKSNAIITLVKRINNISRLTKYVTANPILSRLSVAQYSSTSKMVLTLCPLFLMINFRIRQYQRTYFAAPPRNCAGLKFHWGVVVWEHNRNHCLCDDISVLNVWVSSLAGSEVCFLGSLSLSLTLTLTISLLVKSLKLAGLNHELNTTKLSEVI